MGLSCQRKFVFIFQLHKDLTPDERKHYFGTELIEEGKLFKRFSQTFGMVINWTDFFLSNITPLFPIQEGYNL